MGALAQHKDGQKSNMGTVIGLYLIATFSAGAVCMVLASDVYLKEDYIRCYDDFLTFRNIELVILIY